MDALKRFYIGVGGGLIKCDVAFPADDPSVGAPSYSDQKQGTYPTFAFDLGTYIDLPGVWGTDKLEICPQFQFSYVSSPYLDGFQSKQTSTLKGFYNVASLSIRYKF
jgi:hypothetical protein